MIFAGPLKILLAVALDLILGDPRRWPHIARMAGSLSVFYERFLVEKSKRPRTVPLGILFWCLVNGTMLAGYLAARSRCGLAHPFLAHALDVFVIYQSIAATDLSRHVKQVITPLLSGDLGEARHRLSFIVGRNTRHLDESEISRAAIEAVAESLTDAVIAPLFWAVVGGAPGALVYRTSNTLDSMVGHRDERYEKFGKAAARIDDVLNWVPARLAALCVAGMKWASSGRAISREAAKHASPNAGWTEAAMAHVLNVRLGGANEYDGTVIEGPVFNPQGALPTPRDIARSLRIMWKAITLSVVLLLFCSTAVEWAARLAAPGNNPREGMKNGKNHRIYH